MDTYRAPGLAMLLVSGLVAGFLAYAISRRSLREERMAVGGPQALMERARDLGETDVARAGREYVSQRIVPEMKPMLLDLLKDVESYVNNYFHRAEKTIKSM